MESWEFPNKTNDDIAIVAILDASGSMAPLLNDTLGGFNTFKHQQAAQPGRAYLSLTTFNTHSSILWASRDIQEVPDLTAKEYIPSGGTALYDAVGQTIEAVSKSKNLPAKVLVLVITDGEENSSRSYNQFTLKTLVDLKTQQGWQFVYLGANVDNWKAASAMGFGASAAYTASSVGTRNLYNTVSANATAYRSAAVPAASATSMNWSSDTPDTDTLVKDSTS